MARSRLYAMTSFLVMATLISAGAPTPSASRGGQELATGEVFTISEKIGPTPITPQPGRNFFASATLGSSVVGER